MADGGKNSKKETGQPLERRVIRNGGFAIAGDRYFSPVLRKYEGKIFAVYSYQCGNVIGIVERSGSMQRMVIQCLTNGPEPKGYEVYLQLLDSQLCLVDDGGLINFKGKSFFAKNMKQLAGEVVNVLEPDAVNEQYLAEFDGKFFELIETC